MAYYTLPPNIKLSGNNGKYSFDAYEGKDVSNILLKNNSRKWLVVENTKNGICKIPTGSGVYFFTVTDETNNKTEVLYVGCSNNVHVRLYNHPTLKFITKCLHKKYVISIHFKACDNQRDYENKIINLLNPILNVIVYKKRQRISY
jgi:hypothetical protein